MKGTTCRLNVTIAGNTLVTEIKIPTLSEMWKIAEDIHLFDGRHITEIEEGQAWAIYEPTPLLGGVAKELAVADTAALVIFKACVLVSGNHITLNEGQSP